MYLSSCNWSLQTNNPEASFVCRHTILFTAKITAIDDAILTLHIGIYICAVLKYVSLKVWSITFSMKVTDVTHR